jgi:protein-S-isoprenylcysteine O-methyltransferase Ste14
MLGGLGVALFGLGFILHSASMVFLWTPAFLFLNVMEVRFVEEPELERRLGANYRDYRERVPMLIPKRPVPGVRGVAQQTDPADGTARMKRRR